MISLEILQELKNRNPALGISLRPPASPEKIKELEHLLNQDFPEDIKAFYEIANGFETNDHLFQVLSIEEIIQYKHELEQDRIFFAEYMIYSDTWEIKFNTSDSYHITTMNHKSEQEVIMSNSILDFIIEYADGGGLFGASGLYVRYEALKNQTKPSL